MNANRLWMLGGAVAAVALAVLAWFVGVSPQLQQAHAAADQKVSAQSQLQQTQLQLAQLKKDYAGIGQLQTRLATLQQSIPGTQKVTDFVRQLAAQAAAANVSVTSITIGEPTAYAPAVGATPTPTPNATAAPVTPPLTGDPLVTAANFVLLPVSISATGGYADVMAFTDAVQNHGTRLFLVSQIDVAPDSAPGATSAPATLSGYIYVLVGNG
jgi:Tfp pilus assembly protein PilO